MNKTELEKVLTKIAGTVIEITIRGERSFTFSFEGDKPEATNKILKYFKGLLKSEKHDYDLECNLTCIYIEL